MTEREIESRFTALLALEVKAQKYVPSQVIPFLVCAFEGQRLSPQAGSGTIVMSEDDITLALEHDLACTCPLCEQLVQLEIKEADAIAP